MKNLIFAITILASGLVAASAQKVDYVEPYKPYGSAPFLQSTKVGEVDPTKSLQVPIITWAADGVTVNLNGGLGANPNSQLARAVGRPVQLVLQDNFDKQVADYVSGKSPFLRGTADMIALVAQALKAKDAGLEPIVFIQLSTSTGADGFVAKGITQISDLKGKTIVTQLNGPHLSLIGNMLQDAGLSAKDVEIKFVREITTPPNWDKKLAMDPANAFRFDSSLAGAACIYSDILTLTGGNVGTGLEGTVKGAKTVFSTKTAANVIFDVYAVRKDFLARNRDMVQAFATAHIKSQDQFISDLTAVAAKDKAKVAEMKQTCKPLSGIFMQDVGAVNDYIVWLGVDSQLAGTKGNLKFFSADSPVNFQATTQRIQTFFKEVGLIESPTTINFTSFLGKQAEAAPAPAVPVKPAFASAQAVRKAVESKNSSTLYTYTFNFPAQMAEIRWQDYPEVFAKIYETTNRYGGAVVQLRGHADNFFYNFVMAKRSRGESTYERRGPSGEFEKLPLPQPEQILNDAKTLSYSRAFAVKKAFAQYVRDKLKLSEQEIDMSRFDVAGMGISDPINKNPQTKEERAQNMRGEIVVISVESELPASFDSNDLR